MRNKKKNKKREMWPKNQLVIHLSSSVPVLRMSLNLQIYEAKPEKQTKANLDNMLHSKEERNSVVRELCKRRFVVVTK